MKLVERIRQAFRSPKAIARRQYAAAKTGRLGFAASSGSADRALYTGLRTLRDRSRALVRDVVYAKRAKTVTTLNVVGAGVGLQAQVASAGGLDVSTNDGIERAWSSWCRADACHTGGTLHFGDLERAALGEVFEAGEAFIRMHPSRFGDARVPLALELIEAERVADDHEIRAPEGAQVTMGIEHDAFGRPVAYYFHNRHPHEVRPTTAGRDAIIRVPADQVLHLRLIDRWPQTRGVPWLHAAITRLNQLGEYEEAAVIAARVGASKVGFFENPDWPEAPPADGETADGTPTLTVEAGEFAQLPPGYKFTSWDPPYPDAAFDAFSRACLRGIAAGIGVSYESLSRDYSQSNYSSSRLSLLEDRDLWRLLQAWWVRSFREPLHRRWMQAAVLSGAIPEIQREAYLADREAFERARFKCRGWGWVDPAKEVSAYKEAERAGYLTKADIIAATAGGADIEDWAAARRRELDLIEGLGLQTDTIEEASSNG